MVGVAVVLKPSLSRIQKRASQGQPMAAIAGSGARPGPGSSIGGTAAKVSSGAAARVPARPGTDKAPPDGSERDDTQAAGVDGRPDRSVPLPGRYWAGPHSPCEGLPAARIVNPADLIGRRFAPVGPRRSPASLSCSTSRANWHRPPRSATTFRLLSPIKISKCLGKASCHRAPSPARTNNISKCLRIMASLAGAGKPVAPGSLQNCFHHEPKAGPQVQDKSWDSP